jgi:hypothetical protein
MAKKNKKTAKPIKAWVTALVSGTAPSDPTEGWAVAEAWLADGSGSLESLDPRLALSAIEAAVGAQSVDRLQALDDSPDKELRKAGRRALHRLRSAGVEVTAISRAHSFTLGAEALTIPSRAFLGHTHQEGYAPFLLTATDVEGSCILAGEIGGNEGVRNTTHMHVTRRDLREVWKDADASSDLVEVPFTTGMHFVKHGMESAKELSGRSPHDWKHFLGHISEGTITAAQLLDPTDGMATTLDEEQLAELNEGHLLTERTWFRFWPIPDEAISALFDDLSNAAESAIEVSEERKTERQTEAFNNAADKALADDPVRKQWLTSTRISVAVLIAEGNAEAAAEVHNLSLALQAGLPGHRLAPVLASLRFQAFKLASMAGQAEGTPLP